MKSRWLFGLSIYIIFLAFVTTRFGWLFLNCLLTLMATAEYFDIHVRILKNFACGRFTDTDKLFSQYKILYP